MNDNHACTCSTCTGQPEAYPSIAGELMRHAVAFGACFVLTGCAYEALAHWSQQPAVLTLGELVATACAALTLLVIAVTTD